MPGFEHFLPTHLYFGSGKINSLGHVCIPLGKKALIVTGKNSARKTGLLQRAIDLLNQMEIEAAVFDRVPENPLTTTVEEGVDYIKSQNCNFIIGLGGGSAIDAAKGIAFAALNPGPLSEYIFGKAGVGALPLVAVPTTAGTGSEADSLAVLTNPATSDKKALKSSFIYPAASIVDPDLMATLPPSLVAATGFDALCHNIESFISRASTPLTDVLALYAIKEILAALPRIYKDQLDKEAWEKQALGSTLGGMVIDRAGVVLVHSLEHPLSGLHNIRHGEGLAALLIACLEYSLPAAPEKALLLARALGRNAAGEPDNAAAAVISAVEELMQAIELDNFNLTKLGAGDADVDWLADNSIRTMFYALQNNPRIPGPEDIKNIYRRCMR